MENIRNKVALITGGSKGLGFALARELLQRGAKVALVARGEDALNEARRSLEAERLNVLTIAADVADKSAVYAIIGRVQATLGPIDLLVHNASTLGPSPLIPLADTECETLFQTLETNVVGPFRLSKAVVPSMVLRGGGTVLHVSSDAAVNAYATWGAYGASKAALDHLSRIWAAELVDTGVRVLSVDPGEMDTEMHRAAIPDADPKTLERPERVAKRIVKVLLSAQDYPSGTRVIASEVEISS